MCSVDIAWPARHHYQQEWDEEHKGTRVTCDIEIAYVTLT